MIGVSTRFACLKRLAVGVILSLSVSGGVQAVPVVSSFRINNGAATTANPAVTLPNVCADAASATHFYMASESPTFTGATWRSYAPVPLFTLSGGSGEKTVYFKVKDSTSAESTVTSDTIILGGSGFSIVAWGENNYGQSVVPSPNHSFIDIAMGSQHSLGLKSNGSIVTWGNNKEGQCNLPGNNTGFVSVASGGYHSLGLKSGGTVLAWGYNDYGQCTVPSPNSGFVSLAAGDYNSMGLKSNGTILVWGSDSYGQCAVPLPNTGFVGIAIGNYHCLGLKSDGSIVAWGENGLKQCDVPSPNTGFVAVAAGPYHSLGLKSDGSIVAWGYNDSGQCNVPTPNSGYRAVSAGYDHSQGLKTNGTIVMWGRNAENQCVVPSPNSGFVALAGGGNHALALVSGNTLQVTLTPPDVITDGAKWRLTSEPEGTWHLSGEIVRGQGSKVLTFSSPNGWIKPSDLQVEFSSDATTLASGNYTRQDWSLTTSCAHGTVEVSPAGTHFPHGTTVTLTVKPDPNYWFDRWTGSVPVDQERLTPLVLTMNGDKTIRADVETGPLPPAPQVSTFAINNGTVSTANPVVTLSNRWTGTTSATAIYYMASESATFADTTWQRYRPLSLFRLSGGSGVKTVYFKLKNSTGVESAVTSDSITVSGSGFSILGWGDDATVPQSNRDFVAIADGFRHRLALKTNGSILAWGENGQGQCRIPSPNSGFISIAAGGAHSLGLKSDGTVVAWGSNEGDSLNYLGQCDVPSPNQDFVAISAGKYHSLGLKSDGTVVAWGKKSEGQCSVPSPNRDFVDIAAGEMHSVGLKSDGTVVAWGSDYWDQSVVPQPNKDFIAISTAYSHSLGLKSDGSVVGWGHNGHGECVVPSPNTGFQAVSAGRFHSLGLKLDGSIVAWGNNAYNQLVLPAPNEGFSAISAGSGNSLALAPEGYLQVTLTPSQGVSDGVQWRLTTEAEGVWHNSEETVMFPTGSHTLTFKEVYGWIRPIDRQVEISLNATTALTADYRVVNWTLNTPCSDGSIQKSPEGTSFPHGSTVKLTIQPDPNYYFDHWTGDVPEGQEWDIPLSIQMDRDKTIGADLIAVPSIPEIPSFSINNGAVTTANPVVTLPNTCPGAASSTHFYMASESADFTSATWQPYASVPLFRLSGGKGMKTVYFKVKDSTNTESAPTSDTITVGLSGSIVTWWGDNTYGQLTVPSPNRDFTGFSAGGSHYLGLKADGSIVAWGANGSGQSTVPSPNTDYVAVAAGTNHSLGLRSDGSIRAWGYNTSGQCSVPAPNGDFIAIAAGYAHSLGLKSNGSIVAWGSNTSGQCVIPQPNRDFVSIAAGGYLSMGLKSNGTIVIWGNKDYGQGNIPSPNRNFVAIATGGYHGLGLKTDGSIVAWGQNNYGECRIPEPNRDFLSISAGFSFSLALKTDGSLVACGSDLKKPSSVPNPNSGFIFLTAGNMGALALAPESHTLETSATHGSISRAPDLEVYPRGTTVTLTARPDAGYWFEHWTGDVPEGFEQINPLVLPMVQDRKIEADFEPGPLPAAPVVTSFKINNGAPVTLNPTVTLTNICTAETSGTAVEYQASESSDFSGATWQRYGIVPMFTLTGGKGEKTVYFKVRNNAKGESFVTSDTILLGDAGLPVVAWGDNSEGQGVVPPNNRGFVSLSGGGSYNLGLKSDGSIVQWGKNNNGLYYPPSPNREFISVSAGVSHCLGLKSDGSIVPWGSSTAEVPSPSNGFVAISVGGYDNSIGLKSDGSVVTWDTDVPSPNSGFVAISAGGSHRLGLKFDGSIVAWKSNISGQCNIPSPNRDFVAISAGMAHSLGLKSDGSIVAWGNNTAGQCTIPEPNRDFVAIAAGGRHSLGLKSDGSVVAWGDNTYGQCTIPVPNREYLAIAAGQYHSLALTRNYLQVTLAPPRAVAAGARWRLASEAENVWHESGDTARKIGPQTLIFKDLYGWVTPVNQPVELTASGVTLATGAYTGVNWTLSTSSSNGSILQTPTGNSFPHLTTVTLTAQPDPGFWFDHWTGLVPSGLERVNPLVLTMDANKTIGTSIVSGPLPPAPFISAFSINNGVKTTANPTVILSSTCDSQTSASAVQYLASELPDFTNATWQPYRSLVMYRLSQGNGIKTLYFKVKNSADVESSVTSDTITLGGEGFAVTVWGTNNNGQLDVPPPNRNFLAVAAGGGHNLGLKTDGSIEAWGWNNHGQTLVPSPNRDYVAVAAGVCHSLGLKSDGTIDAWGWNQDGQCLLPSPNGDFVAIAAGERHSLGLKSDGTIVAWGRNSEGQCSVPSPNKGFVAIAAGKNFSLGLKENGSIVVWGGPDANLKTVPVPNLDFVSISAGRAHCLGLKKDGSIMAWGSNLNETGNYVGQSIYPSPNSGFVALSAGWDCSLGLKSDGSIVAWGDNTYGQTSLPPNKSGFEFISGGIFHSIALSPVSHLPMWMISLVDRQTAQEPIPTQEK